MSRNPSLSLLALAAVCFLSPSVPAKSATLSFSSEARIPDDMPSYLEAAYCGNAKWVGGVKAPNKGCNVVRKWMADNFGKPRARWTPPPALALESLDRD